MEPEEKVVQPESVTPADQPVADTPSQPQAPNLDSVKNNMKHKLKLLLKKLLKQKKNLRASKENLMRFTNKKKKNVPRD